MAKIKPAEYIDEITGKIKRQNIAFRRSKKALVLESNPAPSYSRSYYQDQVRKLYSQLLQQYKKLSPQQKEQLRKEGEKYGLPPWQTYIKLNLKYTPTPPISYNITINNTNNPNNLTDYQVLLSISNDPTFFDTISNPKYLEFYDSDKTTLLNHYVEQWDATNYNAKIWLKIPSIPASASKQIYLRVNKTRTQDLSDPTKVFDLFDDFLDLSNWRIVRIGGSGYAKTENSYLKLKSTSAHTTVDRLFTVKNMAIEVKALVISNSEAISLSASNGVYNTDGSEQYGYNGTWAGWAGQSNRQRLRREDNYTDIFLATTSNGLPQNGQTYIFSFIWASTTFKAMNNYTEILTASDNKYSSEPYIAIKVWSGGEYWLDWLRVRKISLPEPQVSYTKA